MTRRREAAARRHGAAQRAAGARPDALGRRRAHRRGRRQGRVGPQAAAAGGRSRARRARRRRASAEAFAVIPLVKRALPEARLPFQDAGVVAVAAGASLGGTLLRRRVRGAGGEAAAAAISLVPALFALRGGDLAAYHGVEHKAIAAYEADDEDAADAAKEHERCGSHLVAPMLAANLAGHGAAAPGGGEARPGGRRRGRARLHRRRRRGVRVDGAQRRARRSPAPSSGPGFEIQRLVGTREPDERQLEVGRAALAEILRVEGAGRLDG